jgi:hypothetical protein
VILAAGLLVLLGLGLFVAGILTGTTVLYWACVAACVVAAVCLFAARRQMTAATPAPAPPAERSEPARAEMKEAPAPAGATASTVIPTKDSAAEESSAQHELPAELEEEGDPGVEEVEVTDLLLVVDLTDEVLVVDEHPRYHVAGCSWLRGRTTVPVPLDQARTDGFTPCAVCSPDRTLAERVRARR